MNWKEAKKIIASNPEVAAELENNEVEYQVISEIVRARLEQKVSQKELAERIGTRQSNISRLESGNYNPSLEFLEKVAEALGKKLEIHFL